MCGLKKKGGASIRSRLDSHWEGASFRRGPEREVGKFYD